jgi:2-amino-4-hydroxy-6-hydroxymethyldihydropteridine diphosphokinase
LSDIFLALGSNMGDRKLNLRQALILLSRKVDIEEVSAIYESDPVGYTQQPLFLNLVLKGKTELKPQDLLTYAKEIETKLGREPSFPNAPRPMDIDILFYDNKIINSPELTIPHPRITVRSFVLIPLNEISPDFIHPGNNRPVKHLVSDLGTIKGLHRWGDAEQIWEKK